MTDPLILHCLSEFPDEKGIETVIKPVDTRVVGPLCLSEFSDEKGIETQQWVPSDELQVLEFE